MTRFAALTVHAERFAGVAHHPLLLGRSLGALVVALGIVAFMGAATMRSRPLLVVAVVAVVLGTLSMVEPASILLLALALAAIAAAAGAGVARAAVWTPAIPPENPEEVERLRLLHGRTHISCFAGDGVKSCLRGPRGAVSYQVRWGVAVAAGDPLAEGVANLAGAAGEFLDLCRRRHWTPCFFQSDAALRPVYRGLGLRLVKFGEEAVVDTEGWNIETPARADARHDVARARRGGLEGSMLRRLSSTDPFWLEAAAVSSDWLRTRGRELGFSLGRWGEAVDSDTWYSLARDRAGRLQAFCSWVRVGDAGIALDLVRRHRQALPGAVDLCVVTAIEAAREAGLARVSLGTVPFRETLGDAPDGRLAGRLRARVFARGWNGYSYRGLSHFKTKFATRWESRDIAVPRGPSSLLALAALARLHVDEPPAPRTSPPVPVEVARA